MKRNSQRFPRPETRPLIAHERWQPNTPRRVVLLGLLACCSATLKAEEAKPDAAPPPSPIVQRERWIPAEQFAKIVQQHPKGVVLSKAQYEVLLRDSGEIIPGQKIAPPSAVVVQSARFSGTLVGNAVLTDAEFVIDALNEGASGWWEVALPIDHAALASLQVGDETVLRVADAAGGHASRGAETCLLVRGGGRRVVKAQLFYPVKELPAGSSFTLTSPGIPASSFELELPERFAVRSDGPIASSPSANTGNLRHTFALPNQPIPVTLSWVSRDLSALAGGAVLQTCSYIYRVDPVRVSADLGVVLRSSLARVPQNLTLTVPNGAKVLSVEGPDLASWDLAEADLKIALLAADLRETNLRVVMESPPEAAPDGQFSAALPFPSISGVHRASGAFALLASPDVRIKNITTAGFTVQSLADLPGDAAASPEFVAGFQFPVLTAPPAILCERIEPTFKADMHTQIDLKRDAVHLTRKITPIVKEGLCFLTTIELPKLEELISVRLAEGVEPKWEKRGESSIEIHWPSGIDASAPPTIVLTSRRDPSGWFVLGEAPLKLEFGAAQVQGAYLTNGYVLVAAEERFHVATADATGLEIVDIAELASESALPGRLAWSHGEDFTLALEVSRKPSEVRAKVTAAALPLLHTCEVHGQVALSIGQSGIRNLAIATPPSVAEHFRFESPLVAERKLEKATGEWMLTFHEELTGSPTIRFHANLPLQKQEKSAAAQGENSSTAPEQRFQISLPVIGFPGLERVSGDWIIEANTDTELSIKALGMDEKDTLTVPAIEGYALRHRAIAAYGWRGAAWNLSLEGVRHPAASLPGLVIDSMQTDSALSVDGTERRKVAMVLRSNGEQFLSVSLPPQSSILTLVLDGSAIKPVAEPKADPQQEVTSVRIQLPATVESRPVSVEMILAIAGKAWDASGTHELTPISLPARTPVLTSQWYIHLPNGFSYENFEGNLHEEFVLQTPSLAAQLKSRYFKPATASPPVPASLPPASPTNVQTAIAGGLGDADDNDEKNTIPPASDQLRAEMLKQVDSAWEQTAPEEAIQGRADGQRVAGLIPITFELPKAGVSYGFSGHHAAAPMKFRYVAWEREIKIGWLYILGGALAALVIAGRRPWFLGLCGVLVLIFWPGIFGPSWQVFCNGALLGWLAALVLLIVVRCLRQRQEKRRAEFGTLGPVTMTALAALLLAVSPRFGQAQEAQAPSMKKPTAVNVYVPFDPKKPVQEQSPDKYFLDYDSFQVLWKQARDNRVRESVPAVEKENEAPWSVLQTALYDGKIEAGKFVIKARLTVFSRGKWAQLPLKFTGANLGEVSLNGSPAPLKDGALLLESPGSHLVEALLEANLPPNWARVDLGIPKATAAMLAFSTQDMTARFKVNGGLPTFEKATADGVIQRTITTALGSAEQLSLERTLAAQMAPQADKLPASVTIDSALYVSPALERLENTIVFQFSGGDRKEFSLDFDPTLTPLSFNIPNLESWNLALGQNGQRSTLTFQLGLPVRDRLQIVFNAERPTGANPLTFPQVSAAATRVERKLMLYTVNELDAKAQPTPAHRQTDFPPNELAGGFQKIACFASEGALVPLPYSITPRTLTNRAVADFLYQVNPSRLDIHAVFELYPAPGTDLLVASVPLGEGFRVNGADSDRLLDWWVDGGKVHLRFRGETPEKTTVFVSISRPWERMSAEVALRPVRVEGFDSVKGRGTIASIPSVDAKLTFAEPASVVREVGVSELLEQYPAIGDFKLTAPLEAKRAFVFDTGEFNGTAKIEDVAPRFDSRWVMAAEIQENWVRLQVNCDVEMNVGALEEVLFTMPADVGEAKVDGKAVRSVNVRDAADGKLKEYRVAFQTPLVGATQFVLSLELPHQGKISLPDVVFPAADLSERFLILENSSGGEVKLDQARTTHVEPMQPREAQNEVHYRVAHFASPRYYRMGSGWQIALTHEKLATTSGTKALVLYAELTTALRANGEEWLRAVYHLQNRNLQFLPIKLPEGYELVSATVAGQLVRADKGERGGLPVLLLPMIQTKPGDLALDVDVVCRKLGSGEKLPRVVERSFADPELPGVTIERTLWRVSLPKGYQLKDAEGNMEKVEEVSVETEKAASMLGELRELISFAKGKDSNSEVISRSKRNAQNIVEKFKSAKYKDASQVYEFEEAGKLLDALPEPSAEMAQQKPKDETWSWNINSGYITQRSGAEAAKKQAELDLNSSILGINDRVLLGNAVLNGSPLRVDPALASKSQMNTRNAEVDRFNKSDGGEAAVQSQIRQIEKNRGQFDDDHGGTETEKTKNQAAAAKNDRAKREQRGGRADNRDIAYQTAQRRGDAAAEGAAKPTTRPAKPSAEIINENLDRKAPGTADPGAVTPSPSDLWGGGFGTGNLNVTSSAPTLLRPVGRVSLAVDFPLEAEVVHFKKVKDHARLTLEIHQPTMSPKRWGSVVALSACLLVLLLLEWALRNRRRSRY